MDSPRDGQVEQQVVRWGAGCLVAAAAMIGSTVLVFYLALALQPPSWIQVLMGLGLVLEGAFFFWLITNAVVQARGDKEEPPVQKGPRPVEDPPKG